MKLSKKNIEIIQNYFKDKPVLKAYLFGSQETGKATPESDIDLLVELDYSKKIGLLFIQMQIDFKAFERHSIYVERCLCSTIIIYE